MKNSYKNYKLKEIILKIKQKYDEKPKTIFGMTDDEYDYYVNQLIIKDNSKKMTIKNIDKIQKMDIEELSSFLCNLSSCNEKCLGHKYCYNGHNGMKDYLNKEVDIDG